MQAEDEEAGDGLDSATEVPDRLGHRPALDGVRGLAIAAVVLYHVDRRHFPGGFVGVDVFFVLSGFLITTLLLERQDQRRPGLLRSFYLRRILRLVPAFAAFVLACAVLNATGWKDLGSWWGIARMSSYVANVFAAVGRWPMPFSHTWSLALEEQFYLAWPLVLVGVTARFGRRRLLAVAVAGVVATALWQVVLERSGQPWARIYFGPDTRSCGLLVGCVLALLWDRGVLARWRVPPALGVAGGLVLLTWVLTVHEVWRGLFLGGLLLAWTASAIVVVVGTGGNRLLTVPPLRHLGDISYGLYLWHPLLISLVGVQTVVRSIIAIGASLAVAEISFRTIELPLRRRRSG